MAIRLKIAAHVIHVIDATALFNFWYNLTLGSLCKSPVDALKSCLSSLARTKCVASGWDMLARPVKLVAPARPELLPTDREHFDIYCTIARYIIHRCRPLHIPTDL